MNNYRNRFEFSYFEINPSGFVFGTKFTVNPSYVLEKGRSMFSEKPTFSSVTCSSTSAPSFFPTKYDLLTRPFGTQITENNGMTVKTKKEALLGSFREYFHGFLVLIDF